MSKIAGTRGRRRSCLLLSAAIASGLAASAGAEPNLDVSGYAWTQYLNGLTPMYKGAANFDYNPFFKAGGMLFLGSQPSENWALEIGLGVAYGNSAIKKTLKDTSGNIVAKTNPNSISLDMNAFLYVADITFKTGAYSLKVGKFHYTYSDYNTNMGLYLLRGPVYPGFLYSGFHEIPDLTKIGALSSWSPFESLRWDMLASFETDFKPYMDLNLSGFLTYKAGLFELGAGFESQRLVELNPCITSPDGADVDECLGGDPSPVYVGAGSDLYKGAYFVIDSSGKAATGKSDTTTYSLAGTKVMLRGALDFKKIMPEYGGSAKDYVLYFEMALLGVKDYPYLYEKKIERMPMLVGMNLPTYGFLDLLSLEVEYYDSPFQNDPYKLVGTYDVFHFSDGNSINYSMSPIPPSNKAGDAHLSKTQVDYDPSKDNWKWSIYLTKKVQKKITFIGQIASDHWRVPNNNFVLYEAASKPSEFYGSLRVEYSL
ncbi:MAG: hypothetical protein JWO30_2155 [Fibrobacteres bacterium]|nr:hypothetical protein [Fibrobacterota bacterium]